jgi:hypothetical protein
MKNQAINLAFISCPIYTTQRILSLWRPAGSRWLHGLFRKPHLDASTDEL